MTDELDPDLRRLFAATADYPADDAFVAAVAHKTAPRRPGVLAHALLTGAIVAALAAGLGLALGQVANWIGPLATASPFGYVAGLALVVAGAVCVRVLAPLTGLDRL
jgi:anti-sigma factor RsiW